MRFSEQGATIKAGNYHFKIHDPFYGEVTYRLSEDMDSMMTVGKDEEWAKEHKDSYTLLNSGIYTLPLGDYDHFPFKVDFSVRGISDPEKMFESLNNAERDADAPSSINFQKQDASVKIGDYTFRAHDSRASEVRYTLRNSPKTLGKDAEWAESHENSYILMDGGAYTIQLSDEDVFPVEVRFSLPRDQVSELEFKNLNHAKLKDGTNDTILFENQDASVTLGDYTFKAHSPWVGAVRYWIEGDYSKREMTVGSDEAYAIERQEIADKKTKEKRAQKNYESADAEKTDYALFQSGKHVIELRNGEYFPCKISFSQWNPETGWGDEETREVKIFDGVQSNYNLFNHEFSIHADWLDEVKYQLPGQNIITVGHDADKAAVRSDYELFDTADNTSSDYAINPNDSIIFPCTVKFTVRNASGSETETEEIFENAGSTVEIRGHKFVIRSVWSGEIVYQVNKGKKDEGPERIVGHDKEWAKSHNNYDAASDDGRYAIPVGDEINFPVKVSFRLRNSRTWTELEFKDLNSTRKIHGVTFSIHPTWLDEVKYIPYRTDDEEIETEMKKVIVGNDAEKAQKAIEDAEKATIEARKKDPKAKEVKPKYVLAVDGKYEIEIEDDAFYPYGIEFSYTRLEKEIKNAGDNSMPTPTPVIIFTPKKVNRTVWFESPQDEHEIGGYTFTTRSKRTDPAKLVRAGLWIGASENTPGQYIPFVEYEDRIYWTDKAAEEEYQASLQSLLPLRESNLYAKLDGFFSWELDNAKLDIELPTIPGAKTAKNQVAWGRANSGDLNIINNGGYVKNISSETSGTFRTWEMITGQLDQLDQNDMRYLVHVETSVPGFIDNQLTMKASYADEQRGGIRIKSNQYDADGAKYIIPASSESEKERKETIGAYEFIVNEQWKDGPAYLTIGLNDQADNYNIYKKLDASVYEGVYLTVDTFKAAEDADHKPVDITSRVWGKELDTQPMNQRYMAALTVEKKDKEKDSQDKQEEQKDEQSAKTYFTVVWRRGGNPVAVMPFQVLIKIDPDAQWELPEDVRPDVIMFRKPHTNNTAVKNDAGNFENWELEFDKIEHDDALNIDFYYYRMPKDIKIGSVAADRFYISAAYRHFTKAGGEDGLGNKTEADLYEPANIDSYYGTYRTQNRTPSETAQNTGEAIWQEYGVKVYASDQIYETLADAQKDENAVDVTAQIFTRTGYGAEYSEGIVFSSFNAKGELFDCRVIRTRSSDPTVEFDNQMTLKGDSRFKAQKVSRNNHDSDAIIYRMPDTTYSARGMYSLRLHYWRDGKEYNWDKIKEDGITVLVSDRDLGKGSLDDVWESGRDVTESAFNDPGYTANYSYGVYFHVYDYYGDLITSQLVMTENYQETKSADTWFRIEGAYQDPPNPLDPSDDTGRVRYAGFAMPYTADSYYIKGYQTIFLMEETKDENGNTALDENGNIIYAPIKDKSEIYPKFWSEDATIYGLDKNDVDDVDPEIGEPISSTVSTSIQKSGENRKIFENMGALRYSAAGENGLTLRNYWVTFLTQSPGGPKLFVNTANDESHYQRDSSNRLRYGRLVNGNMQFSANQGADYYPIIEREAFISDANESHDIFFANIGDERLENLQVALTDESVIKLDEYWHLDEIRYLNAYTTLEKKDVDGINASYGGIPNIGKIRLYSANPSAARDIDTYLIISGDNVEPVFIHLTGTVGDVRIDNPEAGELPFAVKWVPYAQLIHTNNIYGGDTVSFEISGDVPAGKTDGMTEEFNEGGTMRQYRHFYGRLPDGMELRPNGEIYGITSEIGVFTFTVTANFSYRDKKSSDSREYTLTVRENTDENVWSENDWHKNGDNEEFGIEYWIPDMTISSTGSKLEEPYYRSEISETETEKRTRTSKVTPVEWDRYYDVFFAIKNYNETENYANGERDFEWFVDLWLNGKKLNGLRLESEEDYKNITPEERAVYDFFYWNDCQGNVVFGEYLAQESNSNGSTEYTVAGEFRMGKDDSNSQFTGAGNFTVNDKGGVKPTKAPKPTATKRPTKAPTKTPSRKTPTATPVPVSIGGGGGGGSSSRRSTPTPTPSPTPIRYAVRVAEAENGQVSVSRSSAVQGTTITINTTPNTNFVVDNISVTRNNGSDVAVNGSDNRYTFKMPNGPVTVTVKFRQFKIAGFLDIDDMHTFFNDVLWAYNNGLMNGVSEEYFEPDENISYITVVVTIARLAKVDLSGYEGMTGEIMGIPDDAWYLKEALWARDIGLFSSDENSENLDGLLQSGVRVDRSPIPRGTFAIMLRNYLNFHEINTEVPVEERVGFTDADRMSSVEEDHAFQALYKANIFRGGSGDEALRMYPTANTTRGNLAALLRRMSDYINQYQTEKAREEIDESD